MSKERPSATAKRASATKARRANTHPTPVRGYVLPEDAHTALVRTCAQLELLTRVTVARIAYDLPELELSQDALVSSFHRMSRDLDEVVRAARPGSASASQG